MVNLEESTRACMAWPNLLCVCLELFNQKGGKKSSKVYICVCSYSFLLTVLNSLSDSWTSLIAQLVKNPPAMQETPVGFLGWEDLLEKR